MTKHRLQGRGPQCHYCKKYGHIQKNCFDCIKADKNGEKEDRSETLGGKKAKAHKVGLITYHVLGVREPACDWIIDLGATCHICNTKELFEEFHPQTNVEASKDHSGRWSHPGSNWYRCCGNEIKVTQCGGKDRKNE